MLPVTEVLLVVLGVVGWMFCIVLYPPPFETDPCTRVSGWIFQRHFELSKSYDLQKIQRRGFFPLFHCSCHNTSSQYPRGWRVYCPSCSLRLFFSHECFGWSSGLLYYDNYVFPPGLHHERCFLYFPSLPLVFLWAHGSWCRAHKWMLTPLVSVGLWYSILLCQATVSLK